MSKCYINVCGGIGNILFQIANGYAYSKRYDMDLLIDATSWSASQGKSPTDYKDNIFKNFEFDSPKGDVELMNEIFFNFSKLPKCYDDVSLHGYFQSLKYFEDCKDDFINQLCLPEVDTSFISQNNVAFHIRLGDYQKYPHIYGDLTNYFNKQFEKFSPDYQVNVFSDSPELVLARFGKYNFNLIKTSSELEDLTLISQHDNVVCSNSSFSWWASILGVEKKLIIVPDKWLLDRDCSDIYYEGMEKYEL